MKLFLLVLLFTFCDCSKKYKPVVLLHGILTGNDSMFNIRDRILEVKQKHSFRFVLVIYTILFQKHPGTVIYNTGRFSGWSSLENLWYQVQQFGYDLLNITQKYPDGVNFLGIQKNTE